jgi:hypothetical protein
MRKDSPRSPDFVARMTAFRGPRSNINSSARGIPQTASLPCDPARLADLERCS